MGEVVERLRCERCGQRPNLNLLSAHESAGAESAHNDVSKWDAQEQTGRPIFLKRAWSPRPRLSTDDPPLQSLGVQFQAERGGVRAARGQTPQIHRQLPGHRDNNLFFAGSG